MSTPPVTQGTPTVPPPPGGDDKYDQSGKDKIAGILNAMTGGGHKALEQKVEEDHQRRLHDIDMYRNVVKTSYDAITQGKDTQGNPLTPEQKARYQSQYDSAMAQYKKLTGTSKDAKGIAGKMEQVAGMVLKAHGAGGGGGQQQSPRGQTVPPPPAAGGGSPPATTASSPTVPPPPSDPQEMAMQAEVDAGRRAETDKEQEEIRVAGGKKKAEEAGAIEGRHDALKKDGFSDEQIRTIEQSKTGGVGMRTRMYPVKVQDPNGPEGQTIPALQDGITAEVFGPDGNAIDNPHLFPIGLMPTERTGEMPVFNPDRNQFEMQPTYSKSQKVAPGGKAAGPSGGGGKASGGGSGGGTPSPGSGGRHGIPARQANILQKQATAIDEARNSLVGSDPSKGVGGLAADLDVFNSPASVKRLSEYLALVNSQIENEGKAIAGQGAWAAAEWYVGVPQTVIGLQQGALADASRGLTPMEQRFVADYYRTLGTIGGMRAATGASSAKWSFNTLRGELPTPGPVTSKAEAGRRIQNFIDETNVVAKRNPMLRGQTVSPPPSGSDKVIYAKDPSGVVHKAKEGTPLPKGWQLTNAPTASQ